MTEEAYNALMSAPVTRPAPDIRSLRLQAALAAFPEGITITIANQGLPKAAAEIPDFCRNSAVTAFLLADAFLAEAQKEVQP